MGNYLDAVESISLPWPIGASAELSGRSDALGNLFTKAPTEHYVMFTSAMVPKKEHGVVSQDGISWE